LAVPVLVCGLALLGSVGAVAADPPAIEGESASRVTATDATLEATIDPGDAAHGVYYQFQIAGDLGEYVTEIVCPPEPSTGPARPCVGAHSVDALPIAFLPGGSGSEGVSLDLASAGVTLDPGKTYQFRVLVAKAIQSEDTIEWESPAIAGAVQSLTARGSAPSVEAESASNVTSTDATLEARIDTGEAPHGAFFQFQLVEDPSGYSGEIACPAEPASGPFRPCVGPHSPAALPIGFLPAASGPTPVALDLAGAGVTLRPGTAYHFRVLVAPAKLSEDTVEWEPPAVAGPDQTFATPLATTQPTDPSDPSGEPASPQSIQSVAAAPLLQRHRHRRHHRRHHRPRRIEQKNPRP
jgi:hypothetical protein